jgi:hypothetical protein
VLMNLWRDEERRREGWAWSPQWYWWSLQALLASLAFITLPAKIIKLFRFRTPARSYVCDTLLGGLRHHHHRPGQWQWDGERRSRAAPGDRHGFRQGHGGQDGGRRAPSGDVSAPGTASRSRVCTPRPQGGGAAPSRPRVPTTSAVDLRSKENHEAREGHGRSTRCPGHGHTLLRLRAVWPRLGAWPYRRRTADTASTLPVADHRGYGDQYNHSAHSTPRHRFRSSSPGRSPARRLSARAHH